MPPRKQSWADLVPPDAMAAGNGPDAVPYDQSAGAAEALPGEGAPPAPAAPQAGEQPVPDAPVGLAAGIGNELGAPMSTDQLTGEQLAAMDPNAAAATSGGGPEDIAYNEMNQILNDPNAPPEVKAQVEQQIELAARRSMLTGGGR